jgi:uncharacterized protein (DUF488 family)
MSASNDGSVQIYTIGFTKKGAERFFTLLRDAGIRKLLDVRINNRSQLSGFAKRDDLRYFLDELLGAEYDHRIELAPTEELLDDYRNDRIDWGTYEDRFRDLMKERELEKSLSRETFEPATVLLCSEHEPSQCHRRLVVEYLDDHWGDVEAIHLQ